MNDTYRLRNHFLSDESGQDLIEYALIAAFIALACLATIQGFGQKVVGTLYNNLNNDFSNAAGGGS